MIYTDDYGNNVELPTLTLALNEKLNEAAKGGNEEKAQRLRYELLKEILGEEYTAEALNGSNVNEIDLIRLSKVFSEVQMAYTLPIIEDSVKPALKMLEDVLPMIEKMERIQANGGGKPNRQGFSRVK